MKNKQNLYKGLISAVAFMLLISFGSDVAAKFSLIKKERNSAGVATSRDNTILATQTPADFSCNGPIYARVKFSINPNSNFGVRNWGTGDLAKKIYVGGNTDANMYAGGQWFKIYDNGQAILDRDIEMFDDVKGLAVQRLDSAIRVALHGTWAQPDGAPLTNRERAEGLVEFSHDGKSRSSVILPTSITGDTVVNQLEYLPNKGGNHPQDDRARLHNNQQAYFKMVVNTNDDGFYVHYALPASCK
jgi:hypothetical protein